MGLLLGGLWTLSNWRGWPWGDPLSFGLFSLLLAFGVWQGAGIPWLLAGIMANITAWDLARLIAKSDRAERIVDADGIVRRHLQRLSGVLVIGLGLSILALNLRLAFTFDWALILALVMIVALSRAISFLREQ